MFRLDVAALKTVSDAVKSRKPEIDDKFLSVRDENFSVLDGQSGV
ncbi:MAG: hypothetical protein ACFNOM_01480 [Parascardovia denticolens]